MNIPRSLLIIPLCGVMLAASTVRSADGRMVLDDFTGPLAPHWKTKSFVGTTEYHIVTEDGRQALRAESRGTASGLAYELNLSPEEWPILSWTWKISNIIENGDATDKKLDDYAARVYVVFPSLLFWRTKAINYIWANRLPLGTAIPSPYTDNAMMVAVESGSKFVGQWRTEQRNIHDDFRQFFNQETPRLGAVAIMTDTDNTGSHAIAYYGPISLTKNAAIGPNAAPH